MKKQRLMAGICVGIHYQFLQFELKQYDPKACDLLAKLWQGKAK